MISKVKVCCVVVLYGAGTGHWQLKGFTNGQPSINLHRHRPETPPRRNHPPHQIHTTKYMAPVQTSTTPAPVRVFNLVLNPRDPGRAVWQYPFSDGG